MMKIPKLHSRAAKLVALAALVAIVGAGIFWFVQVQRASQPEVQVTTVTKNRLVDSVIGVADIKATDRNVIALSPSSKVVDVRVEKGQRVARGDVLVVLDTTEYENQLEQQSITLDDAESTLRFVTGPSSTMNESPAQTSVSQARIGLENARAAESAAKRNLAAAPSLSSSAVRQAKIALEGARSTADAAHDNLESVKQINSNEVRQAKIALDAAKASVQRAEGDLADLKAKLLAGLITQAEYDAQAPALEYALQAATNACRSAQVSYDTACVTADVANAQAKKAASDADLAVRNAKAVLDAANARANTEIDSARKAVADARRAVRSSEVTLAAARQGASFAQASDRKQASAQRNQIDLVRSNINYLEDKIDQGKLRAVVAGVVSRMDAVAGQYPQLGDLIVVEGASGFLASMDVSQPDSAGIEPGQKATVKLKGIGTSYEGRVAAVAPTAERSATSADTEPRVTVEIAILNPDADLRVGFEADVEVFRDDRPAVLEVALDAIRKEPATGRRFVLVVDDENQVHREFITTGVETIDRAEVLTGLTEGQRVIVNPGEALADGSIVRIA